MSADSLSIAAIAREQQRIEQELQSVPALMRDADSKVVEAEMQLNRARAKALHELPDKINGVKLLAADRESRVFEDTEEEFEAHRLAVVEADYLRSRFRALNSVLTSLASRMKAALGVDNAHARYGEG